MHDALLQARPALDENPRKDALTASLAGQQVVSFLGVELVQGALVDLVIDEVGQSFVCRVGECLGENAKGV
jgi:hypothetical protein